MKGLLGANCRGIHSCRPNLAAVPTSASDLALSDRELRDTIALALGLFVAQVLCMAGRRNTNLSPVSPEAREATHAYALVGVNSLSSGPLVSEERPLVGLRLLAPRTRLNVSYDTPFSVPVVPFLGNRSATAAKFSQLAPSTPPLAGIVSGPSTSTQSLMVLNILANDLPCVVQNIKATNMLPADADGGVDPYYRVNLIIQNFPQMYANA